MAIVDTALKYAPAGTENGVALLKSAVAAANNAIETVQKAVKQAAEVAETSFNAMQTTAVRATKGSALPEAEPEVLEQLSLEGWVAPGLALSVSPQTHCG